MLAIGERDAPVLGVVMYVYALDFLLTEYFVLLEFVDQIRRRDDNGFPSGTSFFLCQVFGDPVIVVYRQ